MRNEDAAMVMKRLKVAGTALIGLAMLAPAAAGAQYYRGGPDPYYTAGYDRGYGNDRGYERQREGYYARDGYDRAPRRDYRDRRDYRRCDRGTGGTIIGAIAGGLLGNAAVGRHGNNTVGALAGAGVGALVGNAVDRDC